MAEQIAQPGADAPEVPASDSFSLSEHEQAFPASGRRPSSSETPPEPRAADPEPEAVEATPAPAEKPAKRPRTKPAAAADATPNVEDLTRQLAEARAELSRRAEPVREPAAREPEPRPTADARPADKFPTYEEWIAQKGHETDDWGTYSDARSDWRYDQRRAVERKEAAQAESVRAYQGHVAAYKDALPAVLREYPDYEAVVAAAPSVSKAVEVASIQAGPKTAYYLATHPDIAAELTQDTLYVHPSNPAFAATVAATRRYLKSLIAEKPAAPKPTIALVAGKPAPRPPTPIATGESTRGKDDPPADDASIAEHERYFNRKRKRA